MRSKRYTELAQQIDKNKAYPIAEAIKLVKETSNTKFDASIEAHFRLGIDIEKTDQQVRGSMILPHGLGKSKKIAVFVTPEKEKEAKDLGAEIVGGKDLIAEIKKTGKCDFEIAVAIPEIMKELAPIAKILGPKGLMPSPKNETITSNLKKTLSELKAGRIDFKNDDLGNIHQVIGKVSFSDQDLLENYSTVLEAIKKAKPASAKGIFIKNITLSSSMGPGVKVELE